MKRKCNEYLKPLSESPLQAYLDNRIQLFDIIEEILRQTGKADIMISTFSTSEEFLRRLYRLKKAELINKSVMLADLKATRKTVILYNFMKNVFDDVYLAENHSKVILIKNSKWTVSICTSQNQTRGNRTESGIVSTDGTIFYKLMSSFLSIIDKKSIPLCSILKK